MVVIWPDRTYSRYDPPQLNKVHILQQPSNAPVYKSYPADSSSTAANALLQPIPNAPFDKHTEDDYIDFYYERNLPEMLSREGPHIAKGDVNGDELEDVYIGGSKNQAGQLYLQTAKGFIKKPQEVFNQYKDFEDVAVLFFDADRDGDLDLFAGAGGNNVPPNSRELQHRLYKNDGRGNFAIDTKAFANNDMNISVAAHYDYDSDGDMDLFVGSRSVSREYGSSPLSYIYQNDGRGHFTDVTSRVAPFLQRAGMITGAVWADVAGDSKKELIVTGQWMTTKIFSYQGNKFIEQNSTGLEDLYGWWHAIAASDVNADGKQDLILGNIGENFYLRPDHKNPVKLWVADLDQNGSTDQFLTRTVEGKDVPVFLKREITDQFPALKKGNLKHSDYAKKTVQGLFSKQLLEGSQKLLFNYCPSIVAINNGNGTFSVKPLPVMVQLSSTNAIEPTDLNGDGKVDLVLGGNLFGFPPQFGRLDGSYGHVLLGDGKGNFKWVEPKESGLSVKGEIKDIKEIKTKNNNYLLITQNDQNTR
jgi:hypothetical protein